MECSKKTQDYFNKLNEEVKKCYKVAEGARKKGLDPIDKVEVFWAKDMAERVVGLISIVAPQISGKGIPE